MSYQDALKAYIEEFSSKNVRFIFTTNHINKVSQGIRSRLVEVNFDCQNQEEAEDAMMEAITLKKVSVTHGDNGVQTKSPSLSNSGQAGMDSRPVKFSGQSEAVPTGPKGPSNAYAKGETSVKGAGSFKNSPAQNNADLEKAPAPSKGDNGVNSRSPVAESRNSTKRRV